MKKKLIAALLIFLLLVATFVAVRFFLIAPPKLRYLLRSEPVLRGRVARSISASGTVEPEELVNVGAQVSGKIMSFGKDADNRPVDYRSRVKAGMVLAQIDDVLYDAELRQRKAEKLQAEAAIITANAAIRQNLAQEQLAKLNWERAKALYERRAMSKSDYDAAEAAISVAQANTASSNASLKQAEAQLAIAEAALIKAQRNMDYCVITSPVDGIIIDRRVSIGQTVVSNMSASSIFLIAKEFSKMQVWVSVNEADIAGIRPGMPVEFTVDTYQGTVFKGVVKKIRLNATMSQNVVTYIVEVDTDNPDGKLIPYLTANVKFLAQYKDDVLHVSNAALRFTPPETLIAPGSSAILDENPHSRFLWVRTDKELLRPVPVTVGLNAGSRIEVISGELKEGDEIVCSASSIKEEKETPDEVRSPFMPQPPKKQSPRGVGSAATRQRAQQNSAPAAKK